MKQNKKVVKYKKPFHINIGVVIFVFIFIYLIYNIFAYMTSTHISVYEVEQGTIAENNIYRGLVLREEQVYNSNYTGALNYYVKEASKVNNKTLVYSVDENGNVSKMISEAGKNSVDSDTLAALEEDIFDFQTSYQSLTFYSVYTFKDNMTSSLNEALNLNALESISDYAANAENHNTFHTVSAADDGVVLYYTDGFENVTTDSFQSEMFDESAYTKNSMTKTGSVQSGAPAYKLITSEIWQIVVPVEEELEAKLPTDGIIQIRFLKDNKTMYAGFSLAKKDGQNYLILELKSAMIRYAKERYLEIELLLSEETGLKIPNTCITEKEFFAIPAAYFIADTESGNKGILVERRDDNGNLTTEYLEPTVYYETEQYYYIDSESVSNGERLIKTDSNDSYIVGTDIASLKGVYNINKGYAVFKQIDVLYQNEEYSIVKTGTTYGISLYDHLALDGSKISENELINGK